MIPSVMRHTPSCQTAFGAFSTWMTFSDFKFLHSDILKLFGIRIVAARIEKMGDLAVLHIADDDMIRDARIQVLFDLRIHHIVILAVCPRHDVFIEGHGTEGDQKRYQKDRQREAEEALPEVRMTMSSLAPDRREKHMSEPKSTAIGKV